jgi:hypothetical protein
VSIDATPDIIGATERLEKLTIDPTVNQIPPYLSERLQESRVLPDTTGKSVKDKHLAFGWSSSAQVRTGQGTKRRSAKSVGARIM